MPLIRKKSMPNEELDSKPMSLDVAMSVRRQNKRKQPIKMSDGGEAENPPYNGGTKTYPYPPYKDPYAPKKVTKPADRPWTADEKKKFESTFSQGGEVESHYDSIADAILAKKQKMSDDSSEHPNEEIPNQYDDLNEEAAHEDFESDLSAEPEDSGQDSKEIDSDSHDMVDSIRRKIRAKRGL